MGLFDLLSGRTVKRQHASVLIAIEVLENWLGPTNPAWGLLVATAANANADKEVFETFTKSGRQLYRIIGIQMGYEKVFDEIAGGTRYLHPREQIRAAWLIATIVDQADQTTDLPRLVKEIATRCAMV